MNTKSLAASPTGPGQPGSRNRLLIGTCVGLAMIPMTLIVLRLLGLICPYGMPTGSMAPAVSAGDHVLMENFTYKMRQPRRGDIVVFKTDGIPELPAGTLYIKRVAGEPGEHVRISDDSLFINERLTVLSNDFGAIAIKPPMPPKGFPGMMPAMTRTNLVVPDRSYYLLGDCSTNSYDCRFYGTVDRKAIMGRICFCYWPPSRIGFVK